MLAEAFNKIIKELETNYYPIFNVFGTTDYQLSEFQKLLTKDKTIWALDLMGDLTFNVKNNLTDAGFQILAGMLSPNGNFPYLRVLKLNGNRPTPKGLTSLFQVLSHPSAKLKILDLSRNEITDEGLQYISSMTSIEELDLTSNKLTPKGAVYIAELLRRSKTLKKLMLVDNELGDEGSRIIAEALSTNTTLIEFNIGKNKITDAGAIALANSLKLNCTLQAFIIHNYNENKTIGDDAAVAFADAIKNHPALKKFWLCCTKIEKKGAKALAQAIESNKTLIELDVSANSMGGDEGVIPLIQAISKRNIIQRLNLIRISTIGDNSMREIVNLLEKNTSLVYLAINPSTTSSVRSKFLFGSEVVRQFSDQTQFETAVNQMQRNRAAIKVIHDQQWKVLIKQFEDALSVYSSECYNCYEQIQQFLLELQNVRDDVQSLQTEVEVLLEKYYPRQGLMKHNSNAVVTSSVTAESVIISPSYHQKPLERQTELVAKNNNNEIKPQPNFNSEQKSLTRESTISAVPAINKFDFKVDFPSGSLNAIDKLLKDNSPLSPPMPKPEIKKIIPVQQTNSENERSWHFDRENPEYLQAEVNGYSFFKASKKDIEKVQKYYSHHPVPGMKIKSVEVINNKESNRAFELRLQKLQKRSQEETFTKGWAMEVDAEWRTTLNELLEKIAQPNTDPNYPNVKLLGMWHGTSKDSAKKIADTGYASLATTDNGYFGKGIYSAHEAEYAFRVYARGALLFNWVATNSSYPVTSADKLRGQPNYKNYDSHFVPVITPNGVYSKDATVYVACNPRQQHHYIEVVVFNEEQCLPRYLVTFEVMLLKLPSSSSQTSQFDATINSNTTNALVKNNMNVSSKNKRNENNNDQESFTSNSYYSPNQ